MLDSTTNEVNHTLARVRNLTFTWQHTTDEAMIQVMLNFFFVLVGIPLNIYALSHPLRHRYTYIWSRRRILALNLSVANIATLVLRAFPGAVWGLTVAWYADEFTCKLLALLKVVPFYASSNISTCLAIDMYLSVFQPLKFYGNTRYIRILMLAAWVVAVVLSIPQLFMWSLFRFPENYTVLNGPRTQCLALASINMKFNEMYGRKYTLTHIVVIFWIPLLVQTFCVSAVLLYIFWYRHHAPSRLQTQGMLKQDARLQLKERLTLKLTKNRRSQPARRAVTLPITGSGRRDGGKEIEIRVMDRTVIAIAECSKTTDSTILEHDKFTSKNGLRGPHHSTLEQGSFQGAKNGLRDRLRLRQRKAAGHQAMGHVSVTASPIRAHYQVKTNIKGALLTILLLVTYAITWTPYQISLLLNIALSKKEKEDKDPVNQTVILVCIMAFTSVSTAVYVIPVLRPAKRLRTTSANERNDSHGPPHSSNGIRPSSTSGVSFRSNTKRASYCTTAEIVEHNQNQIHSGMQGLNTQLNQDLQHIDILLEEFGSDTKKPIAEDVNSKTSERMHNEEDLRHECG